ncbi:MAG: heavy metal-responsive transcriptional regulator [Nitrospira sp.]|nr:heavy metal-responsive transcriptional regulator [Nitrospira sp.]
MAAQLTIGQLARTVGVNVQTVRYYERLNLLNPSARRPSKYRLYGHEEERRLRFIKKAQGLGFTLREISELLTLRVASLTACRGDVQKRAQVKLMQVESKVQDLRVLARALKKLIQTCEAGQSTDRCPTLMCLERNKC